MKRLREARYRARLRREVKAMLGNVCAHKALGGCRGRLEVDHKGSGNDKNLTRSMDPRARWRLYRKQALAGEVRLLCRAHNATDGVLRKRGKGVEF